MNGKKIVERAGSGADWKRDRGSRRSLTRSRWAAVGAAVAVTLGAGGIGISNATIGSGERAVFVAITPCRLFDTRPTSAVGPRTTPLGPGEIYTQTVRGTNGNCTIPTDAIAIAMNVTSIAGTAASYLTIWPSDVAQPLVSSLNWVAGSPPTPNKVDVRLSASGQINLFNNLGTVHVLADVVGYYADHNFDDRYTQRRWAVVASDGSLARGGPGVTSVRSGNGPNGQYEVDFGTDVTGCAATATIGLTGSLGTASPGFITVVGRFGSANRVLVNTFNTSGTLTDSPFHIFVAC